MSTYICSDLHGQYTLFNKMLDDINFSDKDTLYILGDIIDRGPKNIRLLREVMERDNMHCLLGNHEYFMWDFYKNHGFSFGSNWLREGNGGWKTKKQFDVLPKKEKQAILDYLENMYLQVEIEKDGRKFLLSHSSFVAGIGTVKWKKLNRMEVERVVWNSPWRRWEYESKSYYSSDDRIHIIGHVPVQKIYYDKWCRDICDDDLAIKKSNIIEPIIEGSLINIDGGCAFRSRKLFSKAGIICMHFDDYVHAKSENAFTYYNK